MLDNILNIFWTNGSDYLHSWIWFLLLSIRILSSLRIEIQRFVGFFCLNIFVFFVYTPCVLLDFFRLFFNKGRTLIIDKIVIFLLLLKFHFFFSLVILVVKNNNLFFCDSWFFLLLNNFSFPFKLFLGIDVIDSITIRRRIWHEIMSFFGVPFGSDPALQHCHDRFQIFERLPCVILMREILPFYKIMRFIWVFIKLLFIMA